ncbi:MAG: hypothetical protein HY665_01190 [Chloroflexi bacterium]|nr:hypothetical protein [Chloroflexota bacterium]
MKIRTVGLLSALIYTTISVVASGLFFVVTLLGDYDWVTRIGGTTWVFLLSMIILMPVVTPLVKKRLGG